MSRFTCTLSVDQIHAQGCHQNSRCLNVVDENPDGTDIYCGRLVNMHRNSTGQQKTQISQHGIFTRMNHLTIAPSPVVFVCNNAGTTSPVDHSPRPSTGWGYKSGGYSSSDVEALPTPPGNNVRTKKLQVKKLRMKRLVKQNQRLDNMYRAMEDRRDLGEDLDRLNLCAKHYPAAEDFKANHRLTFLAKSLKYLQVTGALVSLVQDQMRRDQRRPEAPAPEYISTLSHRYSPPVRQPHPHCHRPPPTTALTAVVLIRVTPIVVVALRTPSLPSSSASAAFFLILPILPML